MLDAVGLHLRRAANVGDMAASPLNYLKFGAQSQIDLGAEAPPCRLAILGGGQVFGHCVDAAVYRTSAARHRVVWGVGISGKDRASAAFDILEGSCALISTRNIGIPGCDHVPCASSLSALFDDAPPPTREVVLFAHARKSGGLPRPAHIPAQDNASGDMASAIAFLASGETVVTNSYHGTFWAMCLGRKVLCLPFSDKFRQFRDNPVFADPADWPDQIARAERREGVLEDARTRNAAFHEKVRNL